MALLLSFGVVAGLVAGATPASAATFSNATTITVPDAVCFGPPGVATPYPSDIAVSGLTGTVSDVNVTLHNVTHAFQGDLELLLVGPGGGGQNLTLLSDAGTGGLNNASVGFDDAAAGQAPQNVGWAPGAYKPTNYAEISGADVFPPPAPAPSGSTTFAGAFNGIAPNGTWRLYVIDDGCSDAGTIAGGWSLEVTATEGATTSTSVSSSLNPSRTGQSITFTATVTSGVIPVTTGTVTFTEGTTTLAANVPLNASGQSAFTTSGLVEGNHIITATYNGTPNFGTSNGSVNQRVDNQTVVNGTSYCNTGPVTINDNGPATPYPSNAFVTGFPSSVGRVTVTLKNITHDFNGDIEVLLAGPAGQNLVLLSDAGTAAASNNTVIFDDAAAGQLPQNGGWADAGVTITADPTNYSELVPDTFPAPAPAPTAAAALSTFNNTNPNGTWSLYVKDDAASDAGVVAGGWCVNVTPASTITTRASAGGPLGTLVRDVATVTGDNNPTGTVTFRLYSNAACTAQVFVSSSPLIGGTATSNNFAPSAVDTYFWTARYNGDADTPPATSPCGAPNESVSIGKANPSVSTQASIGGPLGTSVNDVATMSGGAGPTGTVTFRLFSDASCTTQVFTSTNAIAGGTATSGSFAPVAPGTYRWRATYNGDANNNAAGTPCNAPNESVTISKANPAISTRATASVPLGSTVNDVATVSGGANPTGTVTFRLFSDAACTTQVFTSTNGLARVIGTATSGDFAPAALGTYQWTAVYNGDANNNAVTSPCNAPNESSTITRARPTITTQAASAATATATNPTGTISDTATIAGGVGATGSITFQAYGPGDLNCNGVVLFTSTKPVNGNGAYTSDPFVGAGFGSYRWVVNYTGDANNRPASSPCNAPNETSTVMPVCAAPPPPGTLPGNTIIVDVAGLTTNGTAGDDVIYGTPGVDIINGAGGNDIIFGSGGNDQISGGDGNDTLCGGDDNDTINGNGNNDLGSGDAGNDSLTGSSGDDILIGGPGTDGISANAGIDACSDAADNQTSCETAVPL